MHEYGMKKDKLEPHRYQYLSKEDSDLYDKVINNSLTNDELRQALIVKIMEKRNSTRRSHGTSRI